MGYLERSRVKRGRNSRKEPGQPWRRRRGLAVGLEEKRAVKWMVRLSVGVVSGEGERGMVALKCGKVLRCSS